MSTFKGRFDKRYQDRVGHWPKHSFLTESSINMANILNEKNLLKDGMNIFEMGSGGCRNFKYMNDINENLNFYANDLYEEASFKNMHESIKDKVTFYEKDTLDLVQTFIPDYKIDLLVAAGHFMHIDTNSIKEIIEIIKTEWKPKNIFMKECFNKDEENTKRIWPRHCHNYDLEDVYNVEHLEDRTSAGVDQYRLYTLK